MNDEKSRQFMNQYMVPNSRENGIDGIHKVTIRGGYTPNEFDLIENVFANFIINEDSKIILIELPTKQLIEFTFDTTYQVELYANSTTGKFVEIENVKIFY